MGKTLQIRTTDELYEEFCRLRDEGRLSSTNFLEELLASYKGMYIKSACNTPVIQPNSASAPRIESACNTVVIQPKSLSPPPPRALLAPSNNYSSLMGTTSSTLNRDRVDPLALFMEESWPGLVGESETLSAWIQSCSDAYPGVDLLREAKAALAWTLEKPENKRTAIRQFLRNWWRKSMPKSVVSGIAAEKWLRMYNSKPDYLLKSFLRGKDISETYVHRFVAYQQVKPPSSVTEVVRLYRDNMYEQHKLL